MSSVGFDMKSIPPIAMVVIAAVFVTAGCGRAPKQQTGAEAVRAEYYGYRKAMDICHRVTGLIDISTARRRGLPLYRGEWSYTKPRPVYR